MLDFPPQGPPLKAHIGKGAAGRNELTRRQRRGARANAFGAAAEAAVAKAYLARGAKLLEQRLRNQEGEIDLVLAENGAIVFAEVKARRTIEQALNAAPAKGWKRRGDAALAYAATIGHQGDIRLDLAAVDHQGRVEIIENAGMTAFF